MMRDRKKLKRSVVLIILVSCAFLMPREQAFSADAMILVVGAGGEPVYAEQFRETAQRWIDLSHERGWQLITIGIADVHEKETEVEAAGNQGDDSARDDGATEDYLRLQAAIRQRLSQPLTERDRTYVVMIGHGTYQPGIAKFNLVGPDVSAADLSRWLEGDAQENRQRGSWVIINSASCSGPFLEALSGPSRTVVTATRSGDEVNVPRFGQLFAHTFSEPESDLDHDGRTSVLEAFLVASAKTKQAYIEEGRIQTEHALIDDNGDGKGTSSDFFRGTRVVQASRDGTMPDGVIARNQSLYEQHASGSLSDEDSKELEDLLIEVEQLRGEKEGQSEELYYGRLEEMMLRIAMIESKRNRTESPRPAD